MRSKKAIINIISSLLLQVVMVISNLIVPIFIIKSFGSNVNGLVTSITQFLAYITLLESGFGPVVKSILYKPIANKNREEIKKILKASERFFRIISYIFIAYIVVLCIGLPLIVSKEFNSFYTLSLVVIISISTFAEYYFGMTYKLYLQAEQRTYVTSFIQIGTTILNTIMIVILIYFGQSIQVVKLASAIIFIARPILQNIYVKKKFNINLNDTKSDYKIKQKWDGLAQHIAAVIHNNTDVVVLTLFTNTVEVSVYSVYLLIVNGIKSVIQAFTGGVDASFGDMIAKGEKEILNRSFKNYELFYFTIATIIFSVTLIMILPFIRVYTQGITDADYYRPVFAFLIVLAEFMWTIRLPYSSITLAAGHFKETMKGAWLESIINIVLSVLLVFKFGIIGVAIGTLVAMAIRTVEFVYHTNKYILERKQIESIIRFLVISVQIIVIILLSKLLPVYEFTNYFIWIKYACIVSVLVMLIVVPINALLYKNEVKGLLNILKVNFVKIKE